MGSAMLGGCILNLVPDCQKGNKGEGCFFFFLVTVVEILNRHLKVLVFEVFVLKFLFQTSITGKTRMLTNSMNLLLFQKVTE